MNIKSSYIYLNRLVVYAFHGVAEQERTVGNEFYIDLRLKVDFSKAAESDELDGTVSYADVFESVKNEMEIPSRLLEHVAMRIGRRLFNDFPAIEEIELKLAKRNPPMGADIDSAGVEIHLLRS